ncbi:MAG TPA: transcriptional regulator, partial [Pantoea sp.]|nr:transcriptional regulator [Pantoea sp.]
MLENHPQPHDIQLENVLFALGNPIRLAILQT